MTIDRTAVEEAIETLRSSFMIEGGDIQLVDVHEDGEVEVALKGACHGCAMSTMHLKMGVEQYLKATIPGITGVSTKDG